MLPKVKKPRAKKPKVNLFVPKTDAIRVLMPVEPSAGMALICSSLSYGFSPTERIEDGTKQYKRLRDAIVREAINAE